MPQNAIVDHSAILMVATRLHLCRIIADSTFGEVKDPPPRLRGWEQSSRDVNSIGSTGYTGYSYFRRSKGVGVSDKVGRVSSSSSSSSSSAEGCLWERRLYRVRAVWIQTHSSWWKGPARLPEISEDQKLIPDLPRATLAILIWLPKDLLPPAFPLPAKGYRRSPIPRTLLPRRHLKTDALVPHDA